MRIQKRLFIMFFCTVFLFANFFSICTLQVRADLKRDPDGSLHAENWNDLKEFGREFIIYAVSQFGAVFDEKDFATYVQNNEAWMNLWKEENVTISNDGTNVTLSKEIVDFIKQSLEKYAKEKEPYLILPTTDYKTISVDNFSNSYVYTTFKNIVKEKGVVVVQVDSTNLYCLDIFNNPEDPISLVADYVSEYDRYSSKPGLPFNCIFYSTFGWVVRTSNTKVIPDYYNLNKPLTSYSELIDYVPGYNPYQYFKKAMINFNFSTCGSYSSKVPIIYSTTGERMRVFRTATDMKNYTVDNRKVYYSPGYYDYTPKDVTVPIKDLTKSVSDMEEAIRKLREQLADRTASEKEIEELLKQILEEMKKKNEAPSGGTGEGTGGGTGGNTGGGTGGGTVSVDMSSTNTWLSKIHDKVTAILNKLPASAQTPAQSALDGIKAALEDMKKTMDDINDTVKSIKRWAVVDTVVDGADALAEWIGLVKGFLTDAASGASAVADSLGGAAEGLTKKFPFSVPWDVLFLVSFLSAEPRAPQFEVPFRFSLPGGILVDHTLKLDFSPLQWLSDVSRLTLSMAYAAGLMKMTAGIAVMGKEG